MLCCFLYFAYSVPQMSLLSATTKFRRTLNANDSKCIAAEDELEVHDTINAA